MYQFGRLIVDIDNTLLQELKLNLENANSADRYTAKQTLSFLLNLQKSVSGGPSAVQM